MWILNNETDFDMISREKSINYLPHLCKENHFKRLYINRINKHKSRHVFQGLPGNMVIYIHVSKYPSLPDHTWNDKWNINTSKWGFTSDLPNIRHSSLGDHRVVSLEIVPSCVFGIWPLHQPWFFLLISLCCFSHKEYFNLHSIHSCLSLSFFSFTEVYLIYKSCTYLMNTL